MRKVDFLALTEANSLIAWLATIIDGSSALHFVHGAGADMHLSDALTRYQWPGRRVTVPMPSGSVVLPGGSPLAANEHVLRELSKGLRTSLHAMDDISLTAWARATMIWGGVYSRRPNGKGNAGWLEGRRAGFATYMQRAIAALKGDDDDSHRQMLDLRSNAGTTKVHSLILPNFVIYDSRVAAALAWLAHSWAKETKSIVPSYLRFACMRPNAAAGSSKRRTPDENVFAYFAPASHPHKHAMWNLRANWVIEAALKQAESNRNIGPWSSRKVEAALFVMGEDLTVALSAGRPAKIQRVPMA